MSEVSPLFFFPGVDNKKRRMGNASSTSDTSEAVVTGVVVFVVVVVVIMVVSACMWSGRPKTPPSACAPVSYAERPVGPTQSPVKSVKLDEGEYASIEDTLYFQEQRGMQNDAVLDANAMMPDVEKSKEFLATNDVQNFAPGIGDYPTKIRDANMNSAVMRRPVFDGLSNRSQPHLWHMPPDVPLPESGQVPDMVKMGFNISPRLMQALERKDEEEAAAPDDRFDVMGVVPGQFQGAGLLREPLDLQADREPAEDPRIALRAQARAGMGN